ncbi:MAG TPA: SpoIIE family protein phosphatase [Mycobacteriales bacterium]|nr:SpoIIE family protein phosphatase [Mycobacteriales bacterium]
MDTTLHELSLGMEPDAVSRARKFTQAALSRMPESTVGDAELVVTELVTNAILHGRPPVTVRVADHDRGARVEVIDHGARPPVRMRDAGHSMTGRGLALVAALTSEWGVSQVEGGKVIWAEIPIGGTETAGPHPTPFDLDGMLIGWEEARSTSDWFTVELGDVPTDLLLEAKSHVDNLVREFVLASSDDTGVRPTWLDRLVQSVVQDFSIARTQIKEQALAAAGKGAAMTHLSLHLPPTAAEAGTRYLSALDEADRYARSARLLTLEAPAVHKVFRRWYVEALVDQLRRQVAGEKPGRPPTFAERLAEEFTRIAPLQEVATRLAMLQRVTADLAAAATVGDVAQAVVANSLEILRADVAVVYLLGDDGMLRAAHRDGVGDEMLAREFQAFSIDDDLPGGNVLRSGEPLVFRSRTDLAARYPHLAGSYPEEMRLLVAPLIVGRHQLGVLALRFIGSGLVHEDSQLTMLTTLAGVTAQALERAMAMSEAGLAADKLALLAEASVVLSSSLDHRAVLQALADLVVPTLADWCVIQLLEDGRIRTVGITHTDPARTSWARSLQDRYPADSTAAQGAAQVIRTGTSELYADIPRELLERSAVTAEHLELIEGLGMTSALVVPLAGRGGVIGALSMIHAESGRRFGAHDVPLAEDIARRAAVAVETAHAFREQSTRLADVMRVAEAAQHAILARPPKQVGAIALAGRYISAAAEALVGGDLYETIARPGAVRLLIGDVRGKGLEAVRVATIVLGEFRAAAADLDDLVLVAQQIDRRVRTYLEDEDFVTALIADINDDGTFTLVSCGHPPPLLASQTGVHEVLCATTVPLGLGVEPFLVSGTLRAGERLLLYTDGLVEARDTRGGFVDLMEVTSPLAGAPLEDVLDQILSEVRRRTGGPLSDDLALLVAEYCGKG